MHFIRSLWLLASLYSGFNEATYTLATDYTGAKFFDGFEFFVGADPTDGLVKFVDETAANATNLAGFMNGGNSSMAIYMGVDTTQQAPNGRGAVRVTSSQAFHHALVIADIVHMPAGCGTWPAFWMVGQDWPNNGEIDIVEGVNLQSTNSMTLHTGADVVIDTAKDFSGELMTANCDVNAPGQEKNAGCQILDTSPATYGSDFNSNGGGVFATEWTSSFIKIWFFPRGSYPNDVATGQPQPSDAWGMPRAVFQGNFTMDDHITSLNIVFDTTFCGQWAGADWPSSSCASLAATCDEYVANNPSAFKEAYWSVNTLQVFQDDGAGGGSSPSTSAAGTSSPATSAPPAAATSVTPSAAVTATNRRTRRPGSTGFPTAKR